MKEKKCWQFTFSYGTYSILDSPLIDYLASPVMIYDPSNCYWSGA